MAMTRMLLAALAAGSLGLLASGCAKEGCLGNEKGCKVVPPCQKVTFTCDASAADKLSVLKLESVSQRPGGWDALGTVGDVKLSNAFTDVVIAGIGNQNYLDPNGGGILDLAPAGKADSVNSIFQVVGVLPADAAHYTELELLDERPARVAVIARGALDGRPAVKVYTRYELTPCDHGVRVRTEIINGGTDNELWSLVDAYYWSGREDLPFSPGFITKDGQTYSGFGYPSFGLLSINDVYRPMPFIAAAGHSNDDQISSIASAMCTTAPMEGFNSDVVSAAGMVRKIVPPRGYETFERFIAVGDSKGVSGAVDVALDVRRQVLGEALVTLTGKVERVGTLGGEREASVLISEGTLTTAEDQRNQWTQAVPAADGTFSAKVPAGKPYVVEVHSFGQKQVEREVPSVSADTDLGTFSLPSSASVHFTVQDDQAQLVDAEIFVVPADEAERTRLAGTFHGRFTSCSPWLGSPPGASPACNRVLVHAGNATAEIPLGRYYFYAFKGPFWTLGRELRAVTAAPTNISFSLTKLPLQPVGTVTADMHVHGAASFDSSIPDYDRVLSFSAVDLEVIIATDHDVVYDYSKILQALSLTDHMTAVTGIETTGHIPFMFIPNYPYPLVIGHYNLWPLKYDPSLPRNGGPFDELAEPGLLFERTKGLFTSTVPIIELNHPWAEPDFGRDLGFPRALSLDIRKDLPSGSTDDRTSGGMYVRIPAGATFTNDGHHAQEVMNGSDNSLFLQYRAFWHYMLNEGRIKTGTANSDSHSLTDNTVGVPRNVVYTTTRAGPTFNVDAFNQAVRDGKVMGTNGPVIEASLDDAAGGTQTPGVKLFAPKPTGKLHVKVTAAPWVPVEEIRFLVNGAVAKTIGSLPNPADPFGTTGLTRFDGEVALSELMDGVPGDAWVVIEAGRALPLTGDLGGGLNNSPDGIPDTTDNNGDGKVDGADVAAGQKIGPLKDQPAPKEGEPEFDYFNLMNGHVVAFTNPFVLDRDGDGAFTAPGAKGGR